jgi:putative protease
MEIEIGRVAHYFNHLNVAVITLTGSMKLGDKIHILGHVTDFEERVASMQVNHRTVLWVKPGDNVAIKVNAPVREHDLVLRVVEEVFEPQAA